MTGRPLAAAPGPMPGPVLALCFALPLALLLSLLPASGSHAAPVEVTDDSGARIALPAPAQRIISLAPDITELLYDAGAGGQVVGASDFSDHPAQARELPRVARAQAIDLERIAALHPDLIVTWGSGYPAPVQEALRRLGIPVYVHEPSSLESIATTIERFGQLAGSADAQETAAAVRVRIAALRERFGTRAPVRVFFQIWSDPIMTISGRHIISEGLRACGAVNVFADLAPVAATVSEESVIARDPQFILASTPGGHESGELQRWRRHPSMQAVAHGRLLPVDSDRLDRATPRMLESMARVCDAIDSVRSAGP